MDVVRRKIAKRSTSTDDSSRAWGWRQCRALLIIVSEMSYIKGSIEAGRATSKSSTQSGSHGNLIGRRGRCRAQAELGPQVFDLIGPARLGANDNRPLIKSKIGWACGSWRLIDVLCAPDLIAMMMMVLLLLLTLCLSYQFSLILLILDGLRLLVDGKSDEIRQMTKQ